MCHKYYILPYASQKASRIISAPFLKITKQDYHGTKTLSLESKRHNRTLYYEMLLDLCSKNLLGRVNSKGFHIWTNEQFYWAANQRRGCNCSNHTPSIFHVDKLTCKTTIIIVLICVQYLSVQEVKKGQLLHCQNKECHLAQPMPEGKMLSCSYYNDRGKEWIGTMPVFWEQESTNKLVKLKLQHKTVWTR